MFNMHRGLWESYNIARQRYNTIPLHDTTIDLIKVLLYAVASRIPI